MISLARILGFAVLLLSCSAPATSQPLSEGYSLDEDRYFLDGEELRVLHGGKLDKLDASAVGTPTALIKPEGWGKTLLVFGDAGVMTLTTDGTKSLEFAVPSEPAGEDEKVSFKLWGDKVVRYSDKEKTVQWVGQEKSGSINPGAGNFKGPLLEGESMLFLTADDAYVLYRSRSPEQPESGKLPFPAAEARVDAVDGHFVIWSPTSKSFLRPGGRSLELAEAPSLGLRSVVTGGYVLGFPEKVVYVSPEEYVNIFASPGFTGEEQFQKSEIFLNSGVLCILRPGESGLTAWWCTPDKAEQTGAMKDQTLLTLSPPSTAGATLLLTETSLEETKIHEDGKIVRNPKTGKESTQSVKGFSLYRLKLDGSWSEVANEPRARVVGPAERIGENFIFATQTEPLHEEGKSRTIDWRYPYPEVVLHAVSLYNAKELWTVRLPRGQAPSLARLPEDKEWPLLGPDGPLLFTTEDDRLSALNLETGEVKWTSRKLPLDESRPAMINWNGELGLIAVAHTTKRFVLFDQDGKILESIRLNDIFNKARKLNLFGVFVICLALVGYIYLAGKKKLFIRRIAGLEALDEAVGRSTEMGKPVLYVTGLADVDDIQTLAALSILSHVAKKTA